VIGVMDLYHPGLMKPAAAQWRMVLLSLKSGKPLVALPAPGLVLLQDKEASDGGKADEARKIEEAAKSEEPGKAEEAAEGPQPAAPAAASKPAEPLDEIGARIAGFRKLGEAWLRIDMAERLARGAHEAIAAGKPYGADDPTIVSIGLNEASFLELMRQAGFRPVPDAAEGAPNWQFRGRPKPRPKFDGPRNRGGNRRPAQQGRQDQDGQAQGAGEGQRARPDRRGKNADGGPRRDRDKRPDRDNRSDRGPRPDRGQRPDRDGGGGRERPIVATGKALAGLGALFGRED